MVYAPMLAICRRFGAQPIMVSVYFTTVNAGIRTEHRPTSDCCRFTADRPRLAINLS